MLEFSFFCALVKVLDWGEDGMATTAETASLRASFRQEVAVWHQLDHPNVTRGRCEFTGANLRGALLAGANLQSANLQDACLIDCSFCGADLRSAHLHQLIFDLHQ
ncbi:hypothetical protein POM88_051573 [Heracleum sosnowskyi]|uniref:Pentapeptide repeat-containing protein n=1 Tax=Heracleum sosnowskyi TaxID=360622 RepID=A0AAD8GS26_9APIA|nr:hypothetical protein POM88_052993 [Heracleum sosnowskyi]KAK1358317.1 hypothetical protein POM88_051573 [Heracleum sosnowskyi]